MEIYYLFYVFLTLFSDVSGVFTVALMFQAREGKEKAKSGSHPPSQIRRKFYNSVKCVREDWKYEATRKNTRFCRESGLG
ncbi:hypothetical protein AKJ45_03530 [candidate division MSBL1 archaeon SCGC-AAA261F19]|uniref:Uncharacterized protein n=1 Tax=candidate division MSBL1 archaeon SCGC-AAA261F19 TaxID=1698275 RepID=A0A133V7K6_9EURY|nr:hypothetical protein AKJ45_03530 [candidate division MSBL1 archaeon SCGC-AAA261F19]